MTRVPTAHPNGQQTPESWALGAAPWQAVPPINGQRPRVIIDNDFSGDPDDLFALVHHLLSPGVDIRLIVGSHLRPDDPFDPTKTTAANAVAVVRDVFARVGLSSTEVIVRGAESALMDEGTAQPSAAATAIVAEALRQTDTPLFYLAGGGLTDLASALLIEPRIADRMTLIWIGGAEHEGLAVPPPGAMAIEYNLLIDVTAGMVVFNHSAIEIWQIPRNVYRQCLVSDAELRIRVASTGPLGRYLYDEVREVMTGVGRGSGVAETYALGDSPLVLLSALRSLFEPDASSSQHAVRPTPSLDTAGRYSEPSRDSGRPMRVYTWIDTRLMFEDMYAKLTEFGQWQKSDFPKLSAADTAR